MAHCTSFSTSVVKPRFNICSSNRSATFSSSLPKNGKFIFHCSCKSETESNSKSLTTSNASPFDEFSNEKNLQGSEQLGRRSTIQHAILGSLSLGMLIQPSPANAKLLTPPPGFRTYTDRLDGYYFFYPISWVEVRGAGADVFFRDFRYLDENVSVNISSPSSSRFKQISDFGTPEEAAKKVLDKYILEFMSTRLGVRRESTILDFNSKLCEDGLEYYEIEVNVKSFANNNQLAIMPDERVVMLEWDRRYIVVLGVSNNRLYELRLQVPEKVFEKEGEDIRQIASTFRVFSA